jgi:hypothetical protein
MCLGTDKPTASEEDCYVRPRLNRPPRRAGSHGCLYDRAIAWPLINNLDHFLKTVKRGYLPKRGTISHPIAKRGRATTWRLCGPPAQKFGKPLTQDLLPLQNLPAGRLTNPGFCLYTKLSFDKLMHWSVPSNCFFGRLQAGLFLWGKDSATEECSSGRAGWKEDFSRRFPLASPRRLPLATSKSV